MPRAFTSLVLLLLLTPFFAHAKRTHGDLTTARAAVIRPQPAPAPPVPAAASARDFLPPPRPQTSHPIIEEFFPAEGAAEPIAREQEPGPTRGR